MANRNIPVLVFTAWVLGARPAMADSYASALDAFSRQDWPAALAKLQPLADKGNPDAEYTLGLMYDHGWGVERSQAEAVRLYRLAAAKGQGGAEQNLANMYKDGLGVPQDCAEAIRLYRLELDHKGAIIVQGNDAPVQYSIGDAYMNCGSGPKDYASAVHWLRLAATAEPRLGANELGLLYLNGQGVPQDAAQAAQWFRKAAELGDRDGQANLGAAYAKGAGVPVDYVQAYVWLALALGQYTAEEDAENRAATTKNRDIVVAHMSAAEIEQAQALIQKWKPK